MTKAHDNPKGTSLAKCPIAIIGMAVLAYGITGLIFGGHGFTAAIAAIDRGRDRTTVESRGARG